MIDNIFKVLLKEANIAFNKGEIPVSAIVVYNNEIIAKAHNLKETNNDVTAHAEILAIKKASKKLKNWRLEGCDIYISLEPCSMCASVIHQSRIDNIYYFTKRDNCGKNKLLEEILVEKNSNKGTNIKYIEYNDELKILLQDFFKKRR